MFVKERFKLKNKKFLDRDFSFNSLYGEITFYRTYSRIIWDEDLIDRENRWEALGQETWQDVVLRVIEGTFSIRKDWYLKNKINWNEDYWQHYAQEFGNYLFDMKWMPPGRGLWCMGARQTYLRGSMGLQNCGACYIGKNYPDDFAWMLDALMNGVGIGFEPLRSKKWGFYNPKGTYDFIISDDREGWVESVRTLYAAYCYPNQKKPRFIYDKIRQKGLLIKIFGGLSSGPEPLMKLHWEIEQSIDNSKDEFRWKTDNANFLGCMTVSGNVRRSAELCKGSIHDKVFLDLKDYEKNPEREAFGWMSNNSANIVKKKDFDKLGEIARRVIVRGEPGYANLLNYPQGRIGPRKRIGREREKDKARLVNPCGEQLLEDKELCTLAELLPTVCENEKEFLKAAEFATFYATTVTLLPTHSIESNRVMARNRRIGIGIIDWCNWKAQEGAHKIINSMRKGYKLIRKFAREFSADAGVPEPLRVTTMKPGGTVPKLPNKVSGIGFPTFEYLIRRIRVQENSPISQVLIDANVPYEVDKFSANTLVFEIPLHQTARKYANKVTLWEQALNLILVQREWSDNAVSNTLYFKPQWEFFKTIESVSELDDIIGNETFKLVGNKIYVKNYDHEEGDIESVLSSICPFTKNVSLLPHSSKGTYVQMPEEGINREEYEERMAAIRKIDWMEFVNLPEFQVEVDNYCQGPNCEIRISE